MNDFLNQGEEFTRPQQPDTTPYVVKLVLATGVVSTRRSAEYILLGVVAFALVMAVFIIPSLFGPEPSKPIIRTDIPISAPMEVQP